MNRAAFLVDGFNLYHSLVEAQRDSGGQSTKWFDVMGFCSSSLPIAGRILGEKASLAGVTYFSAPPTHRSQAKQARRRLYMRCLRETRVTVQLGRFKAKSARCPKCRAPFVSHEGKETDVAIAARLFEICHSDEAETVILVTGDTDLAPAVRTCKRLFPAKMIFFAFAYRRTNAELKSVAPESFSVKLRSCLRHQLPNPLVLPGSGTLKKPEGW